MPRFELHSDYKPSGDQPGAIAELVEGVEQGRKSQVLLGVTGSGKTFTLANVVERVQRPTLVIAHNKTLAAQLYGEFKALFPRNAVEYFVSYYDYYQPEAYVPSSDTFIEKDSSINEEIERMRHSATHALRTRDDVLIVASVSCIYGMGMARVYVDMAIRLDCGARMDREVLLRRLVECQYDRNDVDFHRGTFRVRGDVVEIFPVYEEDRALRIEFFDDTLERISEFDPLRGEVKAQLDCVTVFPGSHYVTLPEQRLKAIVSIREELRGRLTELKGAGKLVEAQRLEQRTLLDLEMLEQLGFCNGIENYSRHLSGRAAGEPPPCLLDYFPKNLLVLIDESHQTLPQIGAMCRGDRARKETLVEFGFRLPSALDNRPLTFPEFQALVPQAVHVSATPGAWELEQAAGVVTEQVIRPTGLVDPPVEVRPAANQVDDLLAEVRAAVARGGRVLVTTLTKRMAEDLTDHYAEVGVRVRYLHSEIDALERSAILKSLRQGDFDVLVGINLLREGLDLPEVSLVAILDADKEGFLRSRVSLIQTIGRAARNVEGRVLMYADVVTESMRAAIDETDRRRRKQVAWNEAHGVIPQSATRRIHSLAVEVPSEAAAADAAAQLMSSKAVTARLAALEVEMREAADALEFERAAHCRDQVLLLRQMELGVIPADPRRLAEPGTAKPAVGRGARARRSRR